MKNSLSVREGTGTFSYHRQASPERLIGSRFQSAILLDRKRKACSCGAQVTQMWWKRFSLRCGVPFVLKPYHTRTVVLPQESSRFEYCGNQKLKRQFKKQRQNTSHPVYPILRIIDVICFYSTTDFRLLPDARRSRLIPAP